jgi:hypothetical protein
MYGTAVATGVRGLDANQLSVKAQPLIAKTIRAGNSFHYCGQERNLTFRLCRAVRAA